MNNSMHPFFSVVIPTYNRLNTLKVAIESVLSQTYTDYEIIVIDNSSVDGTSEYIKGIQNDRIKFISVQNGGIVALSRNAGISVARGEWICFLDSDDWWYADKLEVIYQYVDSADVIYHDLDLYTDEGKVKYKRMKTRQVREPIFTDLLINGSCVANSGASVRKSCILSIGGISEEPAIASAEDFDLWLQLSRITDRFLRVDRVMGAYFIGKSNLSSASDRQIDVLTSIYAKHVNSLRADQELLAQQSLAYFNGCTKMALSRYREAIALFKISLRSQAGTIRLKSLLRILMCLFCGLRSIVNKLVSNRG